MLRNVSPQDLSTLSLDNQNKTDEVFAIAVIAVASMAVNYRRLYERLEKSPEFIKELFDFCNTKALEQYGSPQSV